MQLQPELRVLWEALTRQPCHCHCQAFPSQVGMSLQILPLQPFCLSLLHSNFIVRFIIYIIVYNSINICLYCIRYRMYFSFRYLYRHLLLFYNKNPAKAERSIFCTAPGLKLLTLKQNITLSLYMNQLPKGTAQLKSEV